MRIDKLLCELNIGTRSQVKELIKKGQVFVDGQMIKKADVKVEEEAVTVTCMGKSYRYRPYVYYMLNKPAGVVSATRDNTDPTVMDLMKEAYKESHDNDLTGLPVKDMFPVGRLDKDTVGLLLLTNDGELAHNLLSPGKHVEKTYLVHLDGAVDEKRVQKLETGVDIGEDAPTKPAVVKVDERDNTKCLLTITEGKFHQVKRMFQAVGLTVIYLKRISMGTLTLDEKLAEGQIRELTLEEISGLKKGYYEIC